MPSPRNAVLALTALAASLLAPAPSATAAPAWPSMEIVISYRSVGHHLCAVGSLNGATTPAMPIWQLVIAGARVDGTAIEYDAVTVNSHAYLCYTVTRSGAAYGDYSATFVYTGVGDDAPSVVVAHGLWHPGGDNSVSTGQ